MADGVMHWTVQLAASLFGGLAAYMLDDKFTVKDFFCALVLAGFAGCLVLFLCRHYAIPDYMTAFLCGVAGLTAKPFLLSIKRKYKNGIDKLLER